MVTRHNVNQHPMTTGKPFKRHWVFVMENNKLFTVSMSSASHCRRRVLICIVYILFSGSNVKKTNRNDQKKKKQERKELVSRNATEEKLIKKQKLQVSQFRY